MMHHNIVKHYMQISNVNYGLLYVHLELDSLFLAKCVEVERHYSV